MKKKRKFLVKIFNKPYREGVDLSHTQKDGGEGKDHRQKGGSRNATSAQIEERGFQSTPEEGSQEKEGAALEPSKTQVIASEGGKEGSSRCTRGNFSSSGKTPHTTTRRQQAEALLFTERPQRESQKATDLRNRIKFR